MSNLQVQQIIAAKLILDKPKYSLATEALKELEWKHLDYRRHLHRCVFTFSCLHKIIHFNFKIMPFTIIIPASARIYAFLLPKQTVQSKNSRTKQLLILTF